MKNKNILIIEDDESIANLQKDYLELSGYEVTISNDGDDGFRLLQNNCFDLLVLDIMLPGIDGFEILKRIRDNMDIPVIIVSARQEELYKINGFGLGADDYITKPFSSGELVARIKGHLSKYDRLRERFSNGRDNIKLDDLGLDSLKGLIKDTVKDTIAIRGLRIQKESRRVFINDNEATLSNKEFDLLLFLAQNPNRVYGKETLFEKIWGLDAIGDASTVTVHIARIREKIETDPSKPQYIDTVWGAGYRFRV